MSLPGAGCPTPLTQELHLPHLGLQAEHHPSWGVGSPGDLEEQPERAVPKTLSLTRNTPYFIPRLV